MRAVDIKKSCRWFLQIQCIRVNPARFLDLTPSRSRMYCTKSVHSKAHSCHDPLHPWSTLHAHPSLPGKSCSSVPKVRAVVNWKKAAHLQGRATEQCISFWRGHAKLFVVLTLSLRTASFLRQWHFLEPKLMKSSGWSLHLCCATYQTGKSEGLVPALKNLLKKPDRDATILFTTQGTYKRQITAYICKERKLNPDPTFRLETLKPPVLSGTHNASRNAALPQQGGKYQHLIKTLFFVPHLLGRLNFLVGSSCPFLFIRNNPWPFEKQKQHHCVIYMTKCNWMKVNFKYWVSFWFRGHQSSQRN